MSKRRLLLLINAHPGFVEAEDYDTACTAKYTIDNDELWNEYLAAEETFVTAYLTIRRSVKREQLTQEELSNYEQSEDD